MGIKCLIKKPLIDEVNVAEIEDELDNWREIVGGYIEVIMPFEDRVCIVMNEEGKLEDLPWNFPITSNGKLLDIICGTVAIVGDGGSEFRSLTEEEIKKYTEYLNAVSYKEG